MAGAGYLSPADTKESRILSISSISVCVRSTLVAFSRILLGFVEPGMGIILGMPGRLEMARIQLMAIWPGVQPLRTAISLTLSTSSRFL